MQPARTEVARAAGPGAGWAGRSWDRLHGLGPVLGLVLLCIAGTLLNSDFATVGNAMNVLTRTAFIGIIAVGMCFVIISGGIDLSVGSMAALIAGCVILAMNAIAPLGWPPFAVVAAGMPVYTSRGVGVFRPPLRFHCSPEVTLVELTRSCLDGEILKAGQR